MALADDGGRAPSTSSAAGSSSATRCRASSTTGPRCASRIPEIARELSGPGSFAPCRPPCATTSGASSGRLRRLAPPSHRGHHAGRAEQLRRRPGREPLQPAGPQLHRRRRLRVGAGRAERRGRGAVAGESTWPSPAASTATWGRRASSSSARSARCRAPARARTPTAPTASSWARARAVFLLKRLADAERDGDRIYAVVRGIGGASDGKGKGITAPNPVGQRLAVERAWRAPACRRPRARWSRATARRRASATSSSSRPGGRRSATAGLARGSVALGSVKSNIGHLKAAAGAAGLLKTALALHDKVLPPSLDFERPNPNLDWSASPFAVNTEMRDWDAGRAHPRRRRQRVRLRRHQLPRRAGGARARTSDAPTGTADPWPCRSTSRELRPARRRRCAARSSWARADEAASPTSLRTALAEARQGRHLDPAPPSAAVLSAPERLAIDYADGDELHGQGARRR